MSELPLLPARFTDNGEAAVAQVRAVPGDEYRFARIETTLPFSEDVFVWLLKLAVEPKHRSRRRGHEASAPRLALRAMNSSIPYEIPVIMKVSASLAQRPSYLSCLCELAPLPFAILRKRGDGFSILSRRIHWHNHCR